MKAALRQTSETREAEARPVVQIQDKLWFSTYILFALGLIALHYLVGADFFGISAESVLLFRRLMMGALFVLLALAAAKSIRVYLGILSRILGFALQTPITSFIGWIYLLIRHPDRVGDRIKIGNATGFSDRAVMLRQAWLRSGLYGQKASQAIN